MRAYYQMLKSNFFSVKLQSYRSIILSFIGHLTFIFIQTKQNDRTRRPPRNHLRIITMKKKLYQKSKSNEHKNHVSQRNSCFSLLKEGLGSSINDILLPLVNLNMYGILACHFFFWTFSLLFNCRTCICWMYFQIKRWTVSNFDITQMRPFKPNIWKASQEKLACVISKNPRNALSDWKVIINQLTSQCSFRRHCLRSLNKNPRTLGTACGVKWSEPQAL